ncbi:uncharacterized protein PGTG_06499 [Puccinia graminis f. sp. tritici CRL 75-36-700-3]|uniref:Uncharacterized protein n=1 Tax=Puccinia graminis f. sp. tritici (strain CRL 75-36-700-3 / race SCCL) TaxID=418459 RepID=E3K8S6_PUCGT|nr:uncharacterized protein PGTG_06499 [Puccinia graminis f. sp. tritici CRL 75-36-700-3]EFP80543.2 hypothetical protein PGTG_06499 [Puccinia graminis f. sp. tritici CRL 75-36-700-3]
MASPAPTSSTTPKARRLMSSNFLSRWSLSVSSATRLHKWKKKVLDIRALTSRQ